MIKSRRIDAICCAILAVVLIVTCLFINGDALGITASAREMGYESKLFDSTKVHTLDIVIDDWDGFLETCTNEEYTVADLVIDGESVQNVGLRAKGNTSLTSVASYGNDRYSFKIEVDHYDSGKNYYGLDKFCLNNIIQDNTYLKDYLVYTMMADMGVASPLCSFVYITVNGEDWGLYLAVESVEESFLTRNYGTGYGELYKPDSMSMGGGRGNGQNFDMEEMLTSGQPDDDQNTASDRTQQPQNPFGTTDILSQLADLSVDDILNALESAGLDVSIPDTVNQTNAEEVVEAILENNDMREVLKAFQQSGLLSDSESTGKGDFAQMVKGGGGMSSEDTMLQYIDDDPDSYSNIFSSAKTDTTETDEQRLIASLKTLSEIVDGTVDPAQVADVVDIETVIRYFVVHDFVCNGDSYTGSIVHNYYLYEEDGVMEMIPWDYNLAFGGFSGGGMGSGLTSEVNSPIDSPVSSGDISERPMIAWIFSSEEYTELYHQIYAEFIEKWFDSGYFEQLFDQTVSLISPYVEKDPTAFCSYDEFTEGVETLRQFCLLRAESVSGQLDGTIPSTEDGQNQDSSSLIDASSLDANAMGGQSMGGGRGGMDNAGEMAPGNRGNMTQPDAGTAANETDNSVAAMAPPDDENIPERTDATASATPQQQPSSSDEQSEELPDGVPEVPDSEDAQPEESPADPPDGTALQADMTAGPGNRDMQPGDGMPGQDPGTNSFQWVWVIICGGILLVGIAGVKLYRRW